MSGGTPAAAFSCGDTKAVAGLFAGLFAGLAGVTFLVAGVIAVFLGHCGTRAAGASRGAGFDGTFSAVLASRLAGLLQIVSGGTGLSGFITRRAAVGNAAELVGA